MLAYPVRMRSHSSPARPRANTVPDQPFPSELRGHQGAEQSKSQMSSASPSARKGSLSFLPEVSPTSAGPLKMLRERLRRPSSAGGLTERVDRSGVLGHGQGDSPSLPRRKATRSKTTGSRPSTSSGVLERSHSSKQAEETFTSRFSMSNARRPRNSSFHRDARPVMPVPDKDNGRSSKSRPKQQPLVISNPRLINSSSDLPDDVRFSTADCRIFLELKHKMQAREAQFKLKNGKKHHPYSARDVPYPVHYEKSVIDYGVWEGIWMKSCCHDLTWHPLKKVPQRVLDLGCGSGSWILDCARQWKNASLVGLDIVPIQPDLYQLGSSQMASRITWVQGNFLERLPFQDEEFDLICARRIARGVPEDKWDALLEEVYRVLKPGGTFELIEEELLFPGKPLYTRPPELLDLDVAISSPPRTNFLRLDPYGSTDSFSPPTSISGHYSSMVYSHGDRYPARTMSGVRMGTMDPYTPPPISASSQTSFSSHAYTKSPLHRVTLPPPMEDDECNFDSRSGESAEQTQPMNPRDHSLLEHIYTEMHASRFINLEPLALLKNSLPLYFEETCMHPPTILTFPPSPKSISAGASRTSDPPGTTRDTTDTPQLRSKLSITSLLTSTNPYVLIDDDRFNPFFRKPKLATASDSLHTIYEQFWKGEPDPSLSETVFPRARVFREGHTKRCGKPITDVSLDLQAFPMLLSLRVQEVIGCAEEMWAWVLQYQNMQQHPRYPGGRGTPNGALSPKRDTLNARATHHSHQHPYHETLLNMVRSDFDDLLLWFQLDMQEHIGMANSIYDTLGWQIGPRPRTQARKEFDRLCAEWALHERSLKHEVAAASDMSTPPSDREFSTDESDAESHDCHQHTAKGSARPSATTPVSSLKPWERISRKMFIAVAWKAG